MPRNRLMSKTVFSGLGITPAVAYVAEKGGESIFDRLFGPTKEFQERQAVRDEYQGLADMIRQVAPDFPYHADISAAIARGATQADLNILKAQWSQYQAQHAGTTTAPGITVPGGAIATAGLPSWLMLAIAGAAAFMLFRK